MKIWTKGGEIGLSFAPSIPEEKRKEYHAILDRAINGESVFTFYTDPGHGWIEVPRRVIKDLGIEKLITPFSYQNGAMVYLEEDCDATTFIEAWVARYGRKPALPHLYQENTTIRNYPSYRQGD